MKNSVQNLAAARAGWGQTGVSAAGRTGGERDVRVERGALDEDPEDALR